MEELAINQYINKGGTININPQMLKTKPGIFLKDHLNQLSVTQQSISSIRTAKLNKCGAVFIGCVSLDVTNSNPFGLNPNEPCQYRQKETDSHALLIGIMFATGGTLIPSVNQRALICSHNGDQTSAPSSSQTQWSL